MNIKIKLLFSRIFSSLKNFINLLDNYSSLIIALTGIAGLLMLWLELNNLSKQTHILSGSVNSSNEQTELFSRSLKESYRPIGKIVYNDTLGFKYLNSSIKDRITFEYNPAVINVGNGILVSIGYIYATFHKRERLRDHLFNKTITKDMLKFDTRYPGARKIGICRNEQSKLKVYGNNLEINDQILLNIILFYEDQDGNLYDTEHRAIFSFSKHSYLNNKLSINLEQVSNNNYYHSYSESEKDSLVHILKSYEHPLWEFISDSY